MLERRRFLTGLGALIAAPAIVRATSIMPVRALPDVADLERIIRVRIDFAIKDALNLVADNIMQFGMQSRPMISRQVFVRGRPAPDLIEWVEL